jgi:hypothetical protein
MPSSCLVLGATATPFASWCQAPRPPSGLNLLAYGGGSRCHLSLWVAFVYTGVVPTLARRQRSRPTLGPSLQWRTRSPRGRSEGFDPMAGLSLGRPRTRSSRAGSGLSHPVADRLDMYIHSTRPKSYVLAMGPGSMQEVPIVIVQEVGRDGVMPCRRRDAVHGGCSAWRSGWTAEMSRPKATSVLQRGNAP